MKIAMIASISAVVTMAGCASTVPPSQAPNGEVDTARVAAVDSAARSRGVLVQWVNYPRKRDTAVGVAPAIADPAGS